MSDRYRRNYAYSGFDRPARSGTTRRDMFGQREPGEFNEHNQPIGTPERNNLPVTGSAPKTDFADELRQREPATATASSTRAPSFQFQGSAPFPEFKALPIGGSRVIADPRAEAADMRRGANTGATMSTPYGSVSSRTPSWQELVLQKHPAIGVKGSQANVAFVNAYKAAQAAGKPFDPHQIAANVMQSITSPPKQAENNLGSPDIAAPNLPSSGLSGVTADTAGPKFAGFDVGAAPTPKVSIPETTAARAGAATGNAITSVASGIGNTARDVGAAAYNNVALPVRNFFAPGEGKPIAYSRGRESLLGKPNETAPAIGTRTAQERTDWSTPTVAQTDSINSFAGLNKPVSSGAATLMNDDERKKRMFAFK